MYYRRKILLAMLESAGGEMEKFRLHKLLFLFTRKQEKANYEFVPYKYGAFSFTANSDLLTLQRDEFVFETEKTWTLKENNQWLDSLKWEDKAYLETTIESFNSLETNDLIKYTYENYPFYARNSEISERILGKEKIKEPINEEPSFFTIGYEGRSLEQYLNILLENEVRMLCDVRRNAYSMKYGFSKAQLKKACEGVGIKYEHLPEFGIASAERKELKTPEDYKELFVKYDNDLISRDAELELFFKLIKEEKRVAITCFEADQCNCHRGRLAKKLTSMNRWTWEPKHI